MRRVVAAGSVIGVLATSLFALAASDGSAMGAERVRVEMLGTPAAPSTRTLAVLVRTVFVASNRSRRARRFAIAGNRTAFLKPVMRPLY